MADDANGEGGVREHIPPARGGGTAVTAGRWVAVVCRRFFDGKKGGPPVNHTVPAGFEPSFGFGSLGLWFFSSHALRMVLRLNFICMFRLFLSK